MQSAEENNRALVLEAFDTLFIKRAYAAAERYWSPQYSAAIVSRSGGKACSV